MCSSDGSLIVYQKPFSAKCDRIEQSHRSLQQTAGLPTTNFSNSSPNVELYGIQG